MTAHHNAEERYLAVNIIVNMNGTIKYTLTQSTLLNLAIVTIP